METNRSVYHRGAEDGMYLGVTMALAVLFTAASSYYAWCFVPAIVSVVAVPIVAMRRLRAAYLEDDCESTFSMLWMQGIAGFFFGGLIMGIVSYVAMKWLHPGYIVEQAQLVVDVFSQADSEQYQSFARGVSRAIERGELPTAMDLVAELIYVAVLTGSLLSILLSIYIRARYNSHQQPPAFNNK